MRRDERIAATEAENRQLRQQLEAALARNRLLLERVQEVEPRPLTRPRSRGARRLRWSSPASLSILRSPGLLLPV
jgi:hypothetical protein